MREKPSNTPPVNANPRLAQLETHPKVLVIAGTVRVSRREYIGSGRTGPSVLRWTGPVVHLESTCIVQEYLLFVAWVIVESSEISSAWRSVLVVRFGGHTTALCAVLEPLPMQTHSGWCVVCSQCHCSDLCLGFFQCNVDIAF